MYTPAEAGSLTAAGFYATAPNAAYEVRVADSVAGIRDAAARASGTLAVPGYHTVPLAEPVPVAAGRPVVVAVRVTVPGYRLPGRDRAALRRVRGRDRRQPGRAT